MKKNAIIFSIIFLILLISFSGCSIFSRDEVETEPSPTPGIKLLELPDVTIAPPDINTDEPPFIRALAVVCNDGLYGYVDLHGNVVIDMMFEDAKDFSINQLAPVKINGKYGYLNIYGEFRIYPQFDYADVFKNGYAVVGNDDKFGIIDDKGSIIVPLIYDEITGFGNMELAAVKIEDLYGYVNKKGEIAVEPKYITASEFSGKGLSIVKYGDELWGREGYINIYDEFVIPNEYTKAFPFSVHNIARVLIENDYGYIDLYGEMIIEAEFPYAGDFAANDLAWAYNYSNGKYGYINTDGEWAIEARFVETRNFAANGKAAVKTNGKFGYIDETGKIVIIARYDDAQEFSVNEMAVVMIDDKYGIINDKAEWVLEPIYDQCNNYVYFR